MISGLRDYQIKMINDTYAWMAKHEGNPCIVAPTGCHAKGQGILMADATVKTVEDIVVGDRVMGGDGKPRRVLALHRGESEMCRIVPEKGRPFVVNKDHILSLMAVSETKLDVVNIPVSDYLRRGPDWQRRHKLYRRLHYKASGVEVTCFTVEPAGWDKYYGFEIDGDHLYMLDDLTVTHNSGKSHVIAGLCEDILKRWPKSRIVVLSHVKELLVQDAEKILTAWPEAPIGMYSAGLGSREIAAITVAGIQSIWRKATQVGRVDLAIVDEAHSISTESTGIYRKFLDGLKEINPKMRVIGLTATPYRLGQGMVTEGKNRLFDGLVESVSITELVDQGYLAPLRSKLTDLELDTKGVRKQNGDFASGELQSKLDTEYNNTRIVEETIRRAEGRQAWLVFATGVDHALHLRDEFRRQGVTAETVVGDTPKDERDRILNEFKAGHIRAVTNYGVLTTGFDYPNIDVIVMARPTLSPGLYAQAAGRGLRVKSGPYKDCLVLDFAGNIVRHGPITAIQPPKKHQRQETGETPVKKCPECQEAVPAAAKICPCCGYTFPEPEREDKDYHLNRTEDIMGGTTRVAVRKWHWNVVNSRTTGIPMIRVDFYRTGYLEDSIPLFLCLMHEGYAQEKARSIYKSLMNTPAPARITLEWMQKIAKHVNNYCQPPVWVAYKREGNDIVSR